MNAAEELHVRDLEQRLSEAQATTGVCDEARQQAERITARALQRLTEAQRIGQIGDWEFDLATQAISWSPQVFEIVGRDPGLGPPQNYADNVAMYDAPSRGLMTAKLADAIASGEARDYELVLQRADGKQVDVLGRAVPRKDEHGKVVGLHGTLQDITARKQAAAAATQLAAIVESSEDAIIGKDLFGIITSWNPGAEKLFGYQRAEMLGQPIARLLPPGRGDEEVGILARVARGETVRHFETVRVRSDGTMVDVSMTISAIKDAAGTVVGSSKVAHDITEGKRTERALTASELRYRRLFETAQDGILSLDADTGMVVDVNPFLMKLLGFSHEQFLGKTIWELGFFKDVVANEDKFKELRKKEYVRYENLPLETIDGRRIAVEFVSNVYLVNGRKVIQCNLRDITARRKAEEALRQLTASLEQRVIERTAQLAAANRELEAFSSAVSHDLRVAEAADHVKSAFLATMSHELRTPLNSILGFTGIVLQGLAGPLNPEQTKQLGMVRGSARHLLELINDVLDLSKIEAGQLGVHAEPFDLRASIEGVTASVTPLADKKGLVLTVVVAPSLGDMVSDRRRVEQILINVLNNAIKFTEHGSVTLTAECVDDVLRFRVVDTGIGIKPDDLASLFQPFRQIDESPARQNEGTGLGLAISRRLAGLLGGEISAASDWTKGSEFTVTFPCPARSAA